MTIPAPEKWPIKPEAANKYWHATIAPILTKHQLDKQELLAVRRRLDAFAIGANKTFTFSMYGAPYPGGKYMAHIDYDSAARRPLLMVFVPTIQEEERTLTRDVFENLVVVAFVHEMIHIEQGRSGEFPSLESRRDKPYAAIDMKEEAAAWGKTILEVVRPWLARGKRLPETFAQNSKQLSLVNDDYTHPHWVINFKDY